VDSCSSSSRLCSRSAGSSSWAGAKAGATRTRRIAASRRSARSSLDRYRLLPEFSCLLYGRHGNPFALELCIDAEGRVVEAIDRRSGSPRIASLREDPSAATVRVDRPEVDRLIRKLEASP
jgi:hypothetical protein